MKVPPSQSEKLACLLWDLGRAHATISVNGEKLRHRPAALPPELLQRLKVQKAAIISLLQGGYNPHNSDSKYLMLERLGIGDDLGMPTHSGSPAWLIAVGESMKHSYLQTTNTIGCKSCQDL